MLGCKGSVTWAYNNPPSTEKNVSQRGRYMTLVLPIDYDDCFRKNFPNLHQNTLKVKPGLLSNFEQIFHEQTRENKTIITYYRSVKSVFPDSVESL